MQLFQEQAMSEDLVLQFTETYMGSPALWDVGHTLYSLTNLWNYLSKIFWVLKKEAARSS
jgi:hypothetical protein